MQRKFHQYLQPNLIIRTGIHFPPGWLGLDGLVDLGDGGSDETEEGTAACENTVERCAWTCKQRDMTSKHNTSRHIHEMSDATRGLPDFDILCGDKKFELCGT